MSFEDLDVEDSPPVRGPESAGKAEEEAHGGFGGSAAGGGVIGGCDGRYV